jgi:hypothetical protein
MTEPVSEPPSKPARPLNRWGLGSLSIIQTLLLGVIVIALNYLSAHHFYRWDLSRQSDYTLSPATQRYLRETVRPREKPVKWIIAFRRSSPFYERVRALAEEYQRLSGGKIELEIVDPLRSPQRTQEVAATYSLPLTKDLIIIDARTDDSPVSTEELTQTGDPAANARPSRILNPHVKLVVAEDMALFKTIKVEKAIQRVPSGFQGEDVMTARLVEALEGKSRKMAFLVDKSRVDLESENSPLKSLQNTLLLQNVELRAINLADLERIPEEMEGIVMLAPRIDLTDSELAVLKEYWVRPKSSMLFLLKAGETPPKLRAFLRENGVTPRRDRVISMKEKTIDATARGLFTYGVDFLKDFEGQSTVFEGATSSLEVREGAEDLLTRELRPIGLIQAAPGFWGETRYGGKNTTYDETEDTMQGLYLAASVTRGRINDDRFSADASRMVVIANTDILNPEMQHAENIDFLAASVNWLVNRQSLAGIGSRSLGTYKLPILDAQVSFINRVNLFFLPAFLLAAGAAVWSSRRA